MENKGYQLKKIENNNEIELVEFLKVIINGKKAIIITTIISVILSIGFICYKKNLPRSYNGSIILNDKSYDLLLSRNLLFDKPEKLNLLISKEDIINFVLQDNNLILLQNKNKEQKFSFQINTKESKINILKDNTLNKINSLTSELNIIFKKNLSKSISLKEENLEKLKKEAYKINDQLNKNIVKNKLSLNKDVFENLSLIEPVLYVKFIENQEELKKCYNDIKVLNCLLEISEKENILSLKLENTRLNENVNIYLTIIIGIMFGLFAGISMVLIKDSLKEILEELKK